MLILFCISFISAVCQSCSTKKFDASSAETGCYHTLH